jgi:hypothetical protein
MYDGLWAERIAANCAAVAAHPQASQLSTVFTAARRDLLVRLARAADRVYPLLDRLPQTLLHHDVWLPNLGISGDRTVLVDWAFAGVGPPGSELSQTVALLCQMWGPDVDDDHLIEALFRGLVEDHGLPISFEEVRAGYELSFCLRPAHALGGPVLGGILSGRATMVGETDLESRLASAEAVFRRIERGIRRVDA